MALTAVEQLQLDLYGQSPNGYGNDIALLHLAQEIDRGGGGSVAGTSALIASAIGVNLNATGDTAMTLSAFATGKFFVVDYGLMTNCSIGSVVAAPSIWSAAGATGQSYASFATDTISVPRDWVISGTANAAWGGEFGTMQSTTPLVNVGEPQGAPATADFYVYGRVFS